MKKKPTASPGFTELLRNPRRVLRIALIVSAYLVTFIILDFITKQVAELPGIVAWYPPAGLTYAFLLVFGVGFTPAVTIALLSDSLFIYRMSQSPFLLFLWALIISLIYGAAAAFLRKRIRFDWRLRKLRDVIWFVFTTVLVSALLAVLSVVSSALSGGIPRNEVVLQIFLWWIGETVGVLTITPFLLIYVMPGLKRFTEGQPVKLPARRSFPRLTLSAVGQAASIVLTLYWVFIAQVPAEFRPLYIIALPLIWIALQRGFKGVTAAILVLNSGVVLAMMLFRFDLARLNELQLTMIINCIVCLLMGAVVTERKLAEQGLRQSDLMVHQSRDIILLMDSGTGRILEANEAALKAYGYTRDEMLAFTIYNLSPLETSKLTSRQMKQAKREGILFESIHRRKDGSKFPVEVSSQGLTIDGVHKLVSVIRDITERKQAEQSIRRNLEDLELLYDNSLSINSLLNPEKIGAKVIDAIVKKGISWRHVAVHLYHPEKQHVEMLVHSYPGLRAEERQTEKQRLNRLVSSPNEGFVGWVIQHGELIRCGNVTEDRRYIMAYPDIQAGIYVPMKGEDRVIGVISVESEQADAFTEADEHLLMTLAAQASVAMENARLFSEIKHSNLDLTLAYNATIEGWSHALDLRDQETEGHSQRVTKMTLKLARALGFSKSELVNVRWGALLHDIGKMGVADGILLKPSSLTDVEWRIIKKHPTFAFEWLSPIHYLKKALDIPYCHHEKWDGTGYPRGLKGEAIPLAARIFAIADVWDALTSERPYRKAWTKKKALEYIQEQSGKHFDPDVVKVFLKNPSAQNIGDS